MGNPLNPLDYAKAGLSIVNGVRGMSSANSDARAAYAANNQNLRRQLSEAFSQAVELDTQANEAVSDRVMQTNEELARVRMMAAENGVSGSTMAALTRHVAMAEGLDIGRIEATRKSQKSSLNANNIAARDGTISQNRTARNQAKTAKTSALLGMVGSGLQIADASADRQSRLEAARNKKTTPRTRYPNPFIKE